jgi:hypothetical protein
LFDCTGDIVQNGQGDVIASDGFADMIGGNNDFFGCHQ